MVIEDRDWIAEVRLLAPSRVFVQHNPPTPRYGRAQSKLSYLIRESALIGTRPVEGHTDRIECAAWARPPTGRGYGYYSCFRLFLAPPGLSAALLFCFYDGSEGSPGFKAVDSAQLYASSHGFKVHE